MLNILVYLLILITTSITFATTTLTDTLKPDQTVEITPGPEYEAGWLHKVFLGPHWRSLWTTPVKVNIIDLSKYAGGLTPLKKGGGFQTKSLHFKGNDGKYYKFRSLNKDPKKLLPVDLQETFVADVVKDQISTSHPFSAFIVAPLLNAVGVLNAEPILVLLPDDPILGEYREEFKEVLGTLAENPKDDTEAELIFAGAEKVKDTYKMFETLEEDNENQIDAEEFLKARLMDIFLGDWDRHVGQWKWARFQENDLKIWQPIPRDRDQAFSRYDGLFPWITALAVTQIENFSENYPQVNDITWSGRYLDRRFLTSLTKQAWDSIATHIQTKLTDEVIKSAVAKMPPEWFAKEGNRLITMLKSRRDKLNIISENYYKMIFKYVSVFTSDKAEYAEIKRLDDDQVEVTIYDKDKSGNKKKSPFFHRIYRQDHTKEIRLDLEGGDDTAIVSGEVNRSILVRIVGGKGDDALFDESKINGYFLSMTPIPDAETKTLFYDSGKDTKYKMGPSSAFDWSKIPPPKPFDEEKDEIYEKYEPQVEDRDYDWRRGFWGNFNSDDGLTIGGGPILYKFGFRAKPYVYRMTLQGAYVTNINAFLLNYDGEFYSLFNNAKLVFNANRRVGTINFYNFGNQTKINDSLDENDFYHLRPKVADVTTKIDFPTEGPHNFSVGVSLNNSEIEFDKNSLLDSLQLNNLGNKTYYGFHFGYQLDTRDNTLVPFKGIYIDLRNNNYPSFLNNEDNYYKLYFEARAYTQLNFISTSTIALRGIGEKIWGDYPLHEAAFLGGSRNIRGFTRERFAGDALLFGTAEIRTYLFPLKFIIPGRFGFSAFVESGRVFYENENSNKWHTAYGGGPWMMFLDRSFTANISIAKSAESVLFYITGGFMF